MLVRNCPNKNGRGCKACNKNAYLTDRKGEHFLIDCYGGCSEIFNCVSHFIPKRELEKYGIDFALINTKNMPQISEKYLKSETKDEAFGKSVRYTKGLYYKR